MSALPDIGGLLEHDYRGATYSLRERMAARYQTRPSQRSIFSQGRRRGNLGLSPVSGKSKAMTWNSVIT